MLAKGNGDKSVCVCNLLAISRGEVPFDRIRGLDPRIIDRPGSSAIDEVREDAEWMLRTYEPRATIESIDVSRDNAAEGNFSVRANIT